jgi:peptidoglycan/LPS O-acetylase OafA/YrhL
VLGLPIGYFASYVVLFAIGCVAARHGWLDAVDRRAALPWVVIGALALPILPLVLALAETGGSITFETGFSPLAVTYAFWEPFVACGILAGLLWAANMRGRAAHPVWEWCAAQAYGAFILHPPIIAALAVGLAATEIPFAVKLALVATAGAVLSFLASGIVRPIGFLRRIV